ncbi:MAG: AAA family ATPase [Gammaproteobacteria bacterium]|nr:AAA family ATPase [Gammaproteobacteria bacterium]
MSSRRELLQPASLERLALEGDPFQDEGAPYLDTAELYQRLALLTHLCVDTTRPMLLLGDPGVGKTRFLQAAKQSLTASYWVILWGARDDSTAEQLFIDMAECLGGADGDDIHGSIAEAVWAQLVSINATGRVPVLLVDDADRLADPVLEQLIALGSTPEGWLRVVLGGRAGLDEQVNRLYRELVQGGLGRGGADWLPLIELPPLTLAQIPDYLNLRLANSGWAGDSPFDWVLCEQFHARSRGNPLALNRIASDYLRARDKHESAPVAKLLVTGRNGLMAIVGVSTMVLIVVGLAAIWLWPADEVDGGASPIEALSLPKRPGIAPPPPLPAAVPVAEVNPPSTPVPLPVPAPLPGSSVPAVPMAPSPVPAPPPAVPPVSPSLPPATSSVEETASIRSSSPVSSTRPRPRPPPKPRIPPETGGSQTGDGQASASPPSPPPRPPPAAPISAPPPAPASAPASVGRYVIQLVAFREMQDAISFIGEHQLAPYARVYIVADAGGADLFAVIVGRFATRKAAADAIAQLPASLKATDPWPRTLQGLRLIGIPQ